MRLPWVVSFRGLPRRMVCGILAGMTLEALLKLLEGDARLTDKQIAARLGADEQEVTAARTQLESEGRIVGYQTIVNDDSVGVAAFIEVRCTPEREGGFNRLAERIARFDEVKSCYLMSGGYDLPLMVEAKDLMGVARFVTDKLSSMDGIISTATHFRLKTYKLYGLMFDEPSCTERISVAP